MLSHRAFPVIVLCILTSAPVNADEVPADAADKRTPDEIIAEHNAQIVGGERIEATIDSRFRLPLAGTTIEGIDNKNLKIGSKFPRIHGKTMYGNDYSVRFSGNHKATLVVCWFSACGACLTPMPFENALLEKYKDQGFRIIAINSDATPEQAVQTARKQHVKWTTLHDGQAGPIATELGIRQWPTLFLLDSDGVIIHASPRLEMWRFQVDSETSTTTVYTNELTAALARLFASESKPE